MLTVFASCDLRWLARKGKTSRSNASLPASVQCGYFGCLLITNQKNSDIQIQFNIWLVLLSIMQNLSIINHLCKVH